MKGGNIPLVTDGIHAALDGRKQPRTAATSASAAESPRFANIGQAGLVRDELHLPVRPVLLGRPASHLWRDPTCERWVECAKHVEGERASTCSCAAGGLRLGGQLSLRIQPMPKNPPAAKQTIASDG